MIHMYYDKEIFCSLYVWQFLDSYGVLRATAFVTKFSDGHYDVISIQYTLAIKHDDWHTLVKTDTYNCGEYGDHNIKELVDFDAFYKDYELKWN